MGKRYEPEGNTPLAILYAHGWANVAEIRKHLEKNGQTIVAWDKENTWPAWALQRMGFVVTYGEPEGPLDKIKELRDQLNEFIEDNE